MKKIRYVIIVVLGLFFYTILLGGSLRNIYLTRDGGISKLGFLAGPLKFMAETPSMIKKVLGKDEFFVRNKIASDGFTYFNKEGIAAYPMLLVTYKENKFQQKFDLLDVPSGKLIKSWEPDNKLLYDLGYNKENPQKPYKGSDLYFMHPLMTTDSSLILASQLTSLIAKIDKNNKILWYKNNKTFHHTLEADEAGNIYSCTHPFISRKFDFLPGNYDNYRTTLRDDHITVLNSDTGEEIFNKSVIELLVENGYEELLLYKGQVISDPIHLNDIQPALKDSEYWKKGDLLISCRNISTVLLYRPETNKIIWLKHGPWYNQHDADFYGDNQIVVFGNDVIRDESEMNPPISKASLSFSEKQQHNNIYVYDFSTAEVVTPYTELMKNEKIRSVTSGRCDILYNGDIFIEETTEGRILFGDSISKKIEYVKRLDDENISSLFWSRIIY